MATLNLTPDEFFDIAVIYLFDQFMNPEQVKNENAKEFITETRSFLKAKLIKYYLDSDTKNRFRYKRIKDSFDGTGTTVNSIRIRPEKDEGEEEKEGKLKRLAKKIIGKVLASKELTKADLKVLNEWLEEEEDNG